MSLASAVENAVVAKRFVYSTLDPDVRQVGNDGRHRFQTARRFPTGPTVPLSG